MAEQLEAEPRAIAAVLSGGRGARLGGAKAMSMLAGAALIRRPLAAAADAGLEAIVIAKPSTRLPPLAERVVLEPEQPLHPLCGVVAALERAAARSPRAGYCDPAQVHRSGERFGPDYGAAHAE